MFDALTQKLSAIYEKIRLKRKLTASELENELRAIRVALLEADVALQAVRELTEKVRQRTEPLAQAGNLASADDVRKILFEEVARALGADRELSLNQQVIESAHAILLLGLQGSGKTTTAVKLGLLAKRKGRKPLLVGLDLKRPAAREQLAVLAQKAELSIYSYEAEDTIALAKLSLAFAREKHFAPLILDSAGRLHIDEESIHEVRRIKAELKNPSVLLVADSTLGQDAVNIAQNFNEKVGIDGVILTKVDSDARGGAAISMTYFLGKPIVYVGTGEGLRELEEFEPKRWAGRILGLGDVDGFLKVAKESFEEKEIEELSEKLFRDRFNLNDFLRIIQRTRKLSGLQKMLRLLPGIRIDEEKIEEGKERMKRVEAILFSMTDEERTKPSIISASRKRRIAKGSGTSVHEVNLLLRQFEEMKAFVQRFAVSKSGTRIAKKRKR